MSVVGANADTATKKRLRAPSGGEGLIRTEIVSSWERCLLAGMTPEHFEVPYSTDFDDGGRLVWAATAIIDAVSEDLVDSGIGVLLTDDRGYVVDRRAPDKQVRNSLDRIELAPGFVYSEEQVGTNAIGTAIVQRAPSVVTGSEHFVDALAPMACTACPITDGTGQVVGVVDLTCDAANYSPLMLPLAKRAAGEIHQRLVESIRSIQPSFSPGLAAPGWSSLTPTERTVALLVAGGLTNREAAEHLSVSPHTINFHLRHIFQKLGVRSRVDLARATELASSRARVVAAADDARRRIERDLHDGLQQRLVSLGLRVRVAEASVPSEVRELKEELARVVEGLRDAVQNIREISRGAYPAMLSEGGLGRAVEALARRSPVPVKLDVRLGYRLPDALELSTYYVVSEALANVAKHADASLVYLSIEAARGFLHLSIHDDGVGGAHSRGFGLGGLIERVEAFDGSLQLVSPPGRGTSIRVKLPIPSR